MNYLVGRVTGCLLVSVVVACGDKSDVYGDPVATESGENSTAELIDSATHIASSDTASAFDTSTSSDGDVRFFPADDPNIRYTGRFDKTDPARPTCSLAGSTVTVRFNGTAVVAHIENPLRFDDRRNYYNIFVDGAFDRKLPADWDESVTAYPIVEGLVRGEHTVTIVKCSECATGFGIFIGFDIDGELLPPPPRPTRRIMTIGDSIASGYLIETVAETDACYEEGNGSPYHNPSLSFGTLVAEALGAEHHLISNAGIGLYRNNSIAWVYRTMPVIFDFIHLDLDSSPIWDHSQFIPDAIIIELGTNDYSLGPETAEDYPRPTIAPSDFSATAVAFTEHLLEVYPDSQIFFTSSPLIDNGFLAGENRADDLKNALSMTVEHFESIGIFQVHRVDVSRVQGRACFTHPDEEEHVILANEITAAVRDQMGW